VEVEGHSGFKIEVVIYKNRLVVLGVHGLRILGVTLMQESFGDVQPLHPSKYS
jgi:hypothetical protein